MSGHGAGRQALWHIASEIRFSVGAAKSRDGREH
jgi:hypothetical protein